MTRVVSGDDSCLLSLVGEALGEVSAALLLFFLSLLLLVVAAAVSDDSVVVAEGTCLSEVRLLCRSPGLLTTSILVTDGLTLTGGVPDVPAPADPAGPDDREPSFDLG